MRNNGYHLIFIGLDAHNYNVKDLIKEIHYKLSTSVGELKETDILVIDNESVLSEIVCNLK